MGFKTEQKAAIRKRAEELYGRPLEVDGKPVKLEIDGLPRENNINNLNWKPKLRIRGNESLKENGI